MRDKQAGVQKPAQELTRSLLNTKTMMNSVLVLFLKLLIFVMTGVVHGHCNKSKNVAFFTLCICGRVGVRVSPCTCLNCLGLQMCTTVSDFTWVQGFQTQVLKPVYQEFYTLNYLPGPIQGVLLFVCFETGLTM